VALCRNSANVGRCHVERKVNYYAASKYITKRWEFRFSWQCYEDYYLVGCYSMQSDIIKNVKEEFVASIFTLKMKKTGSLKHHSWPARLHNVSFQKIVICRKVYSDEHALGIPVSSSEASLYVSFADYL
jgi:hypothetical protein